MTKPAIVVDIESLRGVFADRDAGLVLYDRAGRKIHDPDASPLSELAPNRLVDVLAKAQLLSENGNAQVWVCDITKERSAYLIVDRGEETPRPSLLIIASGAGNRWRLLNNIPIGIIALDAQFNANMCNSRACTLLDLPEQELMADGWRSRFRLEDLNQLIQHFNEPERVSLPYRETVSLISDICIKRHLDITVVAQWRSSMQPEGYYLSLVDVGREQLVKDQLERSASEDPLTHLLNRRSFSIALEGMRDDEKRHLGLAFVDLDEFKDVNDRLGHAAGDEMLRIVAMRLRAAIREHDLIARFGGDEFVVAIRNVMDDEQLIGFGKKLELLLNDRISLHGKDAQLSASIGLVHGSRAAEESDVSFAESLLKRGDAAMYQAKREGKSTVRIYSDTLDREIAAFNERDEEYQKALSDGDFFSVFQPILLGDKTIALEALTRVSSGLEAHDSIEQFIETGKQDRKCHAFLDLLTQRAIDTYGGHAARFDVLQGLILNINIDVVQLLRPDFTAQLHRWCETSRLSPRQVCVEVTETALERNSNELLRAVKALREAGFRLSMDDFGTGYSSIRRLLLYEFDQIKIDRFFIEQARHSNKYRAVLNAMVALGQSASIQMLAEGIENQDDLILCQDAGIELLQGFHLARPAPLADLFDLAPGLE